MTTGTKEWWEYSSSYYQEQCKIPIDVHYGAGCPNEKSLQLIGDVKGKKILEIGCGGAQCSIAFAKQGAEVTGIDISEQQLSFAGTLAEENRVKVTLYQGDIKTLPQIKSSSQDVVFSAFALLYVDDLAACFREVFRVLGEKGLFIFSLDHPFFRTIDPISLQVKKSYFETGKVAKVFSDPTKTFVQFTHTISEIFTAAVGAGFVVEKIVEPDSRIQYESDPWYGLWEYSPEALKVFPPTIIFQCKKP